MAEPLPEAGVVIKVCDDPNCDRPHHHIQPVNEEEIEEIWEDD